MAKGCGPCLLWRLSPTYTFCVPRTFFQNFALNFSVLNNCHPPHSHPLSCDSAMPPAGYHCKNATQAPIRPDALAITSCLPQKKGRVSRHRKQKEIRGGTRAGATRQDRPLVTAQKKTARGMVGPGRRDDPGQDGGAAEKEARTGNLAQMQGRLRQDQRMEVSSTTKGVERMAILFLLTQRRIMGRASPSRLTVVPTSSTKETSLVKNS